MADQAPIYDLTLLLSLGAPDEQRAKVLADVEKAIGNAGGSIERNDDWGRRPTAFQINHQAEAEYHLLQFKAPPQMIEELSHTLRITDGVLRFRVIKVRPGTPAAPSSPPPVVAAAPHPSSSAPAATATATAAPPVPEQVETATDVTEDLGTDDGEESAGDEAPAQADAIPDE